MENKIKVEITRLGFDWNLDFDQQVKTKKDSFNKQNQSDTTLEKRKMFAIESSPGEFTPVVVATKNIQINYDYVITSEEVTPMEALEAGLVGRTNGLSGYCLDHDGVIDADIPIYDRNFDKVVMSDQIILVEN